VSAKVSDPVIGRSKDRCAQRSSLGYVGSSTDFLLGTLYVSVSPDPAEAMLFSLFCRIGEP
jgi:hypothetical protein